MKAVHFGAGNIGRGFIGLLLSQSGFEVTFVARNEKQIALLKQRKKYHVTLANDAKDREVVKNITAINIHHEEEVARAICEADLITTAVGMASLPHIAKSVAEGITARMRLGIKCPLHVMACENAIDGSSQLKARVYALMPRPMREQAERFVAFPDTAVDRIVPDQAGNDPLGVTVEPYFEWVIESADMLDGFPRIAGVKLVNALKPYIERKLFTVNTGHCAAAYYGYLKGYATIQQAMKDEGLLRKVKGVLQETGGLLTTKYHWSKEKHDRYVQRMLNRFMNPRLKDDIVRVGRSPLRKLSLNDRLVRPALQSHQLGLDISHLTSAIAAALLFDYKKDQEAMKLQRALREQGVDEVITQIMGIPHKHAIHGQIANRYREMRDRYGRAHRLLAAAE
ncbi:mannitol-1-phosphate 5-dehydrogenase [Paenibacillus sp. J5C_2022]|uniref:mannitol-1-phosphate 5-dehydrogenase n=1 Tax=Paenibacillus sp. J5C2022 TaxID=2977129 RepID=UPI0021D093F6|nr:mannitol-1-phosphate 5-dehydrogenase [Paenibacillus sp. J5C2022]MCU6712223.1 mannitol-1-phosphate 5-dehydrogenase [Paenibacillus sp. J5C2022]